MKKKDPVNLLEEAPNPRLVDLSGTIGHEINESFINHLKEVEKITDSIELFINCQGGEVMIANLIINYILQSNTKYTAVIHGIAAGVGSQIASACELVEIKNDAFFHLGLPSVEVTNASDTDEIVKMLDVITIESVKNYMRHSHLTENEILELMRQGKVLKAEDAVDMGFCHEVIK